MASFADIVQGRNLRMRALRTLLILILGAATFLLGIVLQPYILIFYRDQIADFTIYDERRLYVSEELGFRVEYPSRWTVRYNDPEFAARYYPAIMFISPEIWRSEIRISVAVYPATELNLIEWVNVYYQLNDERAKPQGEISLDGSRAIKFISPKPFFSARHDVFLKNEENRTIQISIFDPHAIPYAEETFHAFLESFRLL